MDTHETMTMVIAEIERVRDRLPRYAYGRRSKWARTARMGKRRNLVNWEGAKVSPEIDRPIAGSARHVRCECFDDR